MNDQAEIQTNVTSDATIVGRERIIQLIRAESESTVRDVVQQVFIGDYERLRDAYIAPWSVFQRVRLDRFVGREWVTREVDAFLHHSDRGFFVLEAAAGLGKTTYLAHLARERGYIHHFVELAPREGGVARGPLCVNISETTLLQKLVYNIGVEETR